MKRLVKSVLFAASIVVTFPLWTTVLLLNGLSPGSERGFLGSAQFLSHFPGLCGVFLRRGFYYMTLESCPADCFIEFGTWFSHRQVRIGANTYIGSRCTIGMVDIGENVLIGSNVDILSGTNQHSFADFNVPINQQGGRFEQIRIGDGCWIGNSSVVMADVAIGCVIGAGSVVARSIEANSVAVGNPARVIASRQEGKSVVAE